MHSKILCNAFTWHGNIWIHHLGFRRNVIGS